MIYEKKKGNMRNSYHFTKSQCTLVTEGLAPGAGAGLPAHGSIWADAGLYFVSGRCSGERTWNFNVHAAISHFEALPGKLFFWKAYLPIENTLNGKRPTEISPWTPSLGEA